MQSFLSRALYLVSPAVIISGGSYYTYSYFWPKKLKTWLEKSNVVWIKEDAENADNQFKAMFSENKTHVSKLNKENLTSETSETDALTTLKAWCKENLDEDWSKELDDLFFKFCVYDPKTVRGLFKGVGKEEEIITEDDDYKVVFTLYYKGESQKYNHSITGVSSSIDADTAIVKLKEWCKAEFDKNTKDSFYHEQGYSILFDLCTKPQGKTVEKRIKKVDSSWTKREESNDELWKNAFEKWKHTPKFIDAVKKDNEAENVSLSSSTEKDEGYSKMKSWCKNGLNKNIYDEGVYPEEYKLLKSACKTS